MHRRGLILDIDNTLYSWVDAFLPSFRAMVNKIAKETSVSELEITNDFKNVYREYGTVEYPFAASELALWVKYGFEEADRARISNSAKKVFSIIYRRNLVLYPEVRQVLRWAAAEGVVIVGLSDALERWICFRLRILGIDKYFAGLYTWHKDPWFAGKTPLRTSIQRRVRLNSSELKPNKAVVERVLRDFQLDRNRTLMVGDSIRKDIRAAQLAGVADIWARYGTVSLERNIETLRQITPWGATGEPADLAGAPPIEPTNTINHFSELMGLIETERISLFD